MIDKYRTVRNKQNITAFLTCAAGVLLNLTLSTVVSMLDLPLYLDTVGTVVIAVIGGYLPGVAVGFVTNMIKSISDPSSLYYGVLNVLIAVFATRLAYKGWFKKLPGMIGAVCVFTLIGGGLGAFIPLFMEELAFDSESLSGFLYSTGFFSAGVSHVLSSIITDIPDKTLTVIIALVILRIIPEKLYHLFHISGWMQTPLPNWESEMSDGKRTRLMSLKRKILLVLGVSLTVVAGSAVFIGAMVYNKTVTRKQAESAQGAAKVAASVVNGDHVYEYLISHGRYPGYEATRKLLKEIMDSSADISYLYVYKIDEEGCHVVYDIETDEVPAETPGTVIPYATGMSDNISALLNGEEVEPVITDDKYGLLLTAFEPVYNSEGKCACYAIVDVDMEHLITLERSFYMEMISIFLAFFILICVFVVWLAKYHIIVPIDSITNCVDSFSVEVDSQESLDDDVRKIRGLNVHTGDEVEQLYKSLCEMTLRQAEQIRSIRRLSDSTARMQDGLIITMADMVESRDSDTGAHVQKTAAYVKIIVEGLKRKGYYPEKITPKFISDVVRSAPLHDVGKINIPDGVLNKAGKLTDEEYEIMKTHTTAGKRIMENAISSVEGDNYLKEARNMAAYHHERWDGKGYPEGLHGEVIPLSARIMAVADVFDALSSPRVYKPAFSLEKSLAIIEEGRGTQFDPKCVEVFMESLTEVKAVLRKFNQEV